MALQVDDIIEFVETWRIENGIANNLELSNDQIIKFVSELQNKIAEMDYSVPEGVTIIGYSGNSNKFLQHPSDEYYFVIPSTAGRNNGSDYPDSKGAAG